MTLNTNGNTDIQVCFFFEKMYMLQNIFFLFEHFLSLSQSHLPVSNYSIFIWHPQFDSQLYFLFFLFFSFLFTYLLTFQLSRVWILAPPNILFCWYRLSTLPSVPVAWKKYAILNCKLKRFFYKWSDYINAEYVFTKHQSTPRVTPLNVRELKV